MYLSLRRYVHSLHREYPFDIIIAAWGYPDVVAAERLCRDLRCPLVAMVLGCDINYLADDPLLRPQIQRGLRGARRVIAVSSSLRDRVIGLGIPPHLIHVQHNGVDGQQFRPRDKMLARDRLHINPDGHLVSFIGRLSPEKGPDVFIEAATHLRRRRGAGGVRIALIGCGSMEARLRARVRALSLEDQLTFYGERPHDEIPDWIAASDVICVPSRREGCPNIVLESLASGTPIVASRVGGVPELLTPCAGLLVPADDPLALSSGIDEALSRQWDRRKLRNSVRELSWQPFGRGLARIVYEVTRTGINPALST
jgi:glycosyltransferase involved in cell wall biosynthesis